MGIYGFRKENVGGHFPTTWLFDPVQKDRKRN